jgi:hypothetical protein
MQAGNFERSQMMKCQKIGFQEQTSDGYDADDELRCNWRLK